MPIYEYKCPECNANYEKIHKWNDIHNECPKCNAKGELKLSDQALHFKGSGFYTTDYKSKNWLLKIDYNNNVAQSCDITGEQYIPAICEN